MGRTSSRCDWLGAWILWSAWAQFSGWGLSALGHLDRAGYLASIAIFAAGLFFLWRNLLEPSLRPVFLGRKSTYTRWIPGLWLILALLCFVGGVTHTPDNFDYLTYRFPRLLHWWWDARWSWLATPDIRQNTSAVGMEWLMAPLLVLFRTDRLFFLINFVSFLFLPGLVFSVFRRAGVRGRVAWSWMWLLPVGFCFVLQAASMGNDMFAAVYFLAALHYAWRARDGSPFALGLSIVSIALVTGSKASNMPLVLPWLVLLWQLRRPLLANARPGWLAAAAFLALVSSFLPIALVNIHYTGSYTGDPLDSRKLQAANPAAGVIGNGLEIVVDNLAPPVWPKEFRWPHQDALARLVPSGYPRFGFTGVPFQIDETAGVGPGFVLLALLGVFYGLCRRPAPVDQRSRAERWLLAASIAIAWLGYMAKMGSEAAPRLVAVYYVAGLLALLLLFPVAGVSIHRLPWRLAAGLALAMAFPLVALSPARPVLPVAWIDAALHAVHAPGAAVAHLDQGYRLRAQRRDELHDLRQAIPAEEKAVGMMGGNDEPAVSLWLPFGSRQAVEVFPASDPAAQQLHYVAVSSDRLRDEKVTLDDLLKKWSMTVAGQYQLTYTLRREPETWYLLRARD